MEDSLSASSRISCEHDLADEPLLARSLAENAHLSPAFVSRGYVWRKEFREMSIFNRLK
jgi:hypothetical protein